MNESENLNAGIGRRDKRIHPVALLAALCLGSISSLAYGHEALPYDMEQMKDVSLLDLRVLQEWHPVATTPPTRRKDSRDYPVYF